jgi:deoxyribodipyrimidine photo-lyase
LQALNIPLLVQIVDSVDDIPTHLLSLMQQHQLDTLYYNERYDAIQRAQDKHIQEKLLNAQLQVKHFVDQVIAPPSEILSPKEKPFTSFSAFKKAWQSYLRHANVHPLGAIEKQVAAIIPSPTIPALPFAQQVVQSPWKMTEQQALTMLKQELKDSWEGLNTQTYASHTHHLHALFAYLSIGLLSPRQFIHMLLQGEHLSNKQEVDKWLGLLITREFDMHVMYHFPHICHGHDFTPHMHTLPWQKEEALLNAWQQGHTGFPIIDASMRCLNQTGYLPEHLLKANALFFTKILFMDYRLGEAYFAKQRLDNEFASNNALWQWSASTGAESVIYARIPQPARQSELFDSAGELIRQYCPELSHIDAIQIHDPHTHCPEVANTHGYPKPVVDYNTMRKKTLYHFKALNKSVQSVEA